MVKTPNWPVDQFAALIDRILGATGLNKAQLASIAGMNPSQLSRWIGGSTRPRFESLVTLGEALKARHPQAGVGPQDLVRAAGYDVSIDASDAAALAEAASVTELPALDIAPDDETAAAVKAGLDAIQQLLAARDAEIARLIEEQSKEIAKQSKEIGQLRNEVRRLTTDSDLGDTDTDRRESA